MGRSFDELVNEAEQAPIESWDFGWLQGRATEQRPSWRYFDHVAKRAATVSTCGPSRTSPSRSTARSSWCFIVGSNVTAGP